MLIHEVSRVQVWVLLVLSVARTKSWSRRIIVLAKNSCGVYADVTNHRLTPHQAYYDCFSTIGSHQRWLQWSTIVHSDASSQLCKSDGKLFWGSKIASVAWSWCELRTYFEVERGKNLKCLYSPPPRTGPNLVWPGISKVRPWASRVGFKLAPKVRPQAPHLHLGLWMVLFSLRRLLAGI